MTKKDKSSSKSVSYRELLLVDDYIQVENDRIQFMQTYLPEFRDVLPEIRVTPRYYQLENKINAVVKYELAANIPLVK